MHRMQEGIENMKNLKIFGLALGVVALVAALQPAQAACGAPFLITSLGVDGTAYVVNPTVTYGYGGNGLANSSITESVTGFFWGVGVGDPAFGVGADNGTFEALSWLYVYPNYPSSVLTTWAQDPGIDTCIDVMGPLGERCQVTYFQDVSVGENEGDPPAGTGLFAIVSTPDNAASGDFYLSPLDIGGNIVMAPQEGMAILSSTRAGDTGVQMSLSGPTLEGILAGSYLSDSPLCQGSGAGGAGTINGLIVGYRAKTMVLPRSSAPPSDFSADRWDTAGEDTALGSPSSISVPCDGDSDVYASYQLLFDSGFAAPIVSATTTRVECGPNLADPDNIRVRPEGRSRNNRTR